MSTEFCFVPWSGACILAQPIQIFVAAMKIKFHLLFCILLQALIRECEYLYFYFDLL